MWFRIPDSHSTMRFNLGFMSMLAECQQNFNLPKPMKEVSEMYIYFTHPVTNCDIVLTPFFMFSSKHSAFHYVRSQRHV